MMYPMRVEYLNMVAVFDDAPRLMYDHPREHVGLQHHQHADKASKRNRVPENETQNRALVPEPVRGGRRNDNGLGIDHLTHHSPRRIGGSHQDRRKPELLRRDLLQIAEQNI